MKIKFNLNNYEPVPEGEQVLEITKAECKPSGKPTGCAVTFKDDKGRIINNTYDFNKPVGLTIFAILCRHALDMQDMDEFDTDTDTQKLVGKKLICEISHSQGSQQREDGTFATFANIKKIIGKAGVSENNTTQTVTQNPRTQIATPIGDDLD